MVLAAGLLAAVFAVHPVSSATAHDYLADSNPQDGEVIQGGLDAVSLTFTEAPLANLSGASLVAVTGPDGGTVSADSPTLDGASLSVPVEFTGSGTYQVVWQTVSSDGHPISGEFSFQWENAGPAPTAPAPSAESSAPSAAAPATEPPAAAPTPEPAPAAAVEQPGEVPLWVPLTFGAVAVLVLGTAVYVVSRPRRGHQTTPGRG